MIQSYIGNPEHFPVLARRDFFNHAGVAPISGAAAEAIRRFADQAETDVYIGTNWYVDVENLRKSAASLINAHRDEIAFVKNTSEGLSFVANGVDFQPGDVIVTTGVEYPANIYPWMDLEQRRGVRLVMVPEEIDDQGARQVPLEKILDAASDARCRMVTLSHVEFASGQRHDIARIGRFCRERGILFCVDAIQTLGVIPVDVRAMNIDYLSADGHKWLLGPEGAGIFYIRRELIESTRPTSIGWLNVVNPEDFGHYDFTFKPDAGRYESGSYNLPGLLGLKASLELLQSIGIDAIAARVKQIGDNLVSGLRRQGWQVLSPRTGEQWSGGISFIMPGKDLDWHKRVFGTLRKDHRIELALREQRLRASPHFYNTDGQIDKLLDVLESLARQA